MLHVRDGTLDPSCQCPKDILNSIQTVLNGNSIRVSGNENQCRNRCKCGGCCEEREVTVRVRPEEPKEEQENEKAEDRKDASVVSFVHG